MASSEYRNEMQKQIEMFQTDLIIQINIGRLTMSYHVATREDLVEIEAYYF